MRSVVVDKVASVAQHSELGHELRLSGDIPCEEGVLVAVRVLNNKARYNQLELTSGRMATVNQGDVVVGALGHRKALRGYSGHLPKKLEAGDTIQLLNIGGVLGICDSANPDVGPPFECKVLGTKGRVAFEAPAAITLITAHRELEKLVLSAQQMRVKDTIAAVYGDLVHEGKQLDLVCADSEAFLKSAQQRVTGTVNFALRPGNLFIEGIDSDHSLLAATKGVYGEAAGEWTAADALGYARILSLPGSLHTRAAGEPA